MKFILPEKRFAKTFLLIAFAALLFSTGLQAQTKKKTAPPAKKAVAKKSTAPAKDARKSSKKETLAKKSAKAGPKKATAKSSARDKKSSKQTAARDSRSKNAKETAREKNSKKPSAKMTAKQRRAEEARRRAEEARRQAAIAAQRRREEAARIARERKLAFERGLKTQTAENILRDNIDGEDLVVRKAAIDALGARAGTVVVMEAKTGRVVTMVNQEWAIKNSFKPCSTIKLVTGVAGLNEKVINGEGGIGSSTSGMDLDMALARSSNGYFQRAGSNFGNEKMIAYAKSLGLGERTGINAEGETAGKLPFGNRNARIYSHGDDFEVTPLQLAVMVSAITNDGKKVVPQIVKPKTEKTSFRPKFRDQIKVPYETVQGVIPGMIGAAEYGTARRGVDPSQGIAGKTGSCIYKGSWIGLFASVAPVEQPEYSVVVITRGEGERGKYAAAVAGHVYRVLGPRMRRNQEKYLALKSLRPHPPADNIAASDEDEEEDDTGGQASHERPTIVAGAAANRPVEEKKLVQRTTQSKPTTRPTFPKVVIEFDKSGADKSEAAKTRPRIVKN